MSKCNCFDNPPAFLQTDSFQDKINKSLCKCPCRFSVTEKQSKFSIENVSIDELEKIKIDGFLETSNVVSKCDYLFIYHTENNSCYIFVELKGSNIIHAVEQIRNTIISFHSQGCLKSTRVRAAIVSSRFPKDDGSFRKAILELHKNVNSKLNDFRIFHKNRQMTYNPLQDSYK